MIEFALYTRDTAPGVPAPDGALPFALISLLVNLLVISTRVAAPHKLHPPTVNLDQNTTIPCVASAIVGDAAGDYPVYRSNT